MAIDPKKDQGNTSAQYQAAVKEITARWEATHPPKPTPEKNAQPDYVKLAYEQGLAAREADKFKLPTPTTTKPVLEPVDNWDYKTATTDRQGNKPIDFGGWAPKPQGYDPNGDLYFGPGLQGWLKKLSYRALDIAFVDVTKQDEHKTAISDGFQKIKEALSTEIKKGISLQTPEKQADSKEQSQKLGSGVGEVIKGFWGVLGSGDSPLKAVVGGVNLATSVVIDALQSLADTTEAVLTMNKTMRQYADENGSRLPSVGEIKFDPIMIGKEYAITDELVNTFLRNAAPVLNIYDSIRFWATPGTVKDKIQAYKTGWYEGRMLYSELVKPAVQEEFISRMKVPGANPDLIAMELQDPLVELAGELIFDPLNMVSVFAKEAKFANIVEKAAQKGGVVNETADLFKAASSISTEAQASELMDKTVAVIQDYGYAKAADGAMVQKAIKPLEYNATALDASGMITKQTKSMSEFVTWMAGNIKAKGGLPDDLGEAMSALVNLSSKDSTDVKRALSFLKGSEMIDKPMIFMGQQALETSHMLRNIMGEGDDIEKMVNAIQKAGWDGQAQILDDILKRAAKTTYPSVVEMSEAAKKVAAGSATEREIHMAEQYKAIVKQHPGIDVLAKFNFEASKPQKWVNGILSNAYFSRYGFVNRQILSNTMMVFKEGGFSAFFRDGGFKSIADIREELALFHPAGLPDVLKQKSIVDTVEMSDNVVTQLFKKFKDLPFSPQSLAAKVEQESGMRVYYKFMRDTMDKASEFGVGLPKLDEWTAKGYTAEQALDWKNIFQSHGYNVTETNKIFNKKYANGAELWRDLSWVGPDMQKGLKEYGGWDSMVKFLNDPSHAPDEISKFFQQMYDGIAKKSATHLDPNVTSQENALTHIQKYHSSSPEMRAYEAIGTHIDNADRAAMEAFKNDFKNASQTARQKVLDLSQRAASGQKLKPEEVSQLQLLNDWLRNAENHINQADEIFAQSDQKLKQLKNSLDAWMEENKGLYKYGDGPRDARWKEWYAAVEQAREEKFKFYNGGGAQLSEDFKKLTGQDVFAASRKASIDLQASRLVVADKEGNIFTTLPSGLKFSVVGDAGHENNVYQLANAYGIRTSSRTGAYQELIDYIKLRATPQDMAILGDNFGLQDVPLEMAEKYFAEKTGLKKADGSLYNVVQRLKGADPKVVEAGNIVENTRGLLPASPIHPGGTTGFSEAQVWKNGQEELTKALKYIENGIKERVGLRGDPLDAEKLKSLREFEKTIAGNMSEAKLTASKVGSTMRDFALHPYGETTNLDRALSYVYPYHFWTTRTYMNFAKSLVTNGNLIAGYGKVKDAMASLYADQPEWFKYNVKFPDFFGTNGGNPYMFNLENAIWPLQGITGVDFNDPMRRSNWFTATIDDMGKFGTSTWGPISMAIAAYYLIKGDKEHAAAWGTRLLPQTETFKAISSYWGTPIELDPNVHLFQEGLDPREEDRISKALSAMVNEGKYTEQQLLEAARTHQGDAWNEAYQRATQKRAPGSLASSLLGVAFRPRTQEDITTQQFYDDLYRMRNLHDGGLMSDEQYRQGFNELRNQYPFMDILLLSRRAGMGRDSAYAYNVISRIPPGMTTEIYKAVGVDKATADKFYESGGKMEGWSEAERMDFMAGMINAGAMLQIPTTTTRQEWLGAKNMYSQMQEEFKKEFGDDIINQMNDYYSKETKQEKQLFLDTHPDVAEAMDLRTAYIANNPQLLKYYGGIDTIERYYTSQMYDKLDKQYPNIQPLLDEYNGLAEAVGYDSKLLSRAQKEYKKQHPELQQYWDARDAGYKDVLNQVVKFGDNLPVAEVTLTGNKPENQAQTNIQDLAQPAPQITFDQWSQAVGEPMTNLILDYYHNGKDLTYPAQKQLERLAEKYGFDSGDALLQEILMSIQ